LCQSEARQGRHDTPHQSRHAFAPVRGAVLIRTRRVLALLPRGCWRFGRRHRTDVLGGGCGPHRPTAHPARRPRRDTHLVRSPSSHPACNAGEQISKLRHYPTVGNRLMNMASDRDGRADERQTRPRRGGPRRGALGPPRRGRRPCRGGRARSRVRPSPPSRSGSVRGGRERGVPMSRRADGIKYAATICLRPQCRRGSHDCQSIAGRAHYERLTV